ncbi:hypothetical protein QYE76_025554 [Lolium multiflorum]|uniref:Protein kinase domain-containing protein n=1 Tax=Lolium multiflorum TaxID=4521 RepID=A0AAD8RH48_LOLMU|nr:hypothetical protein QYE76_025554 [Lolium multiflorum]
MGAADAALDTVATAAHLAGTAVSHLSMANVGGIISMILKLAQKARRNKKECVQLAGDVRMIQDLLSYLQCPEEKATREPLEGLVATLKDALELVKSYESGTMVGRVITANQQASKLADIQKRINFYLRILPLALISQIAKTIPRDRIPIGNAASQGPASVPPPPPTSRPVVPAKAAKDEITWAEVAAASTVTVDSTSPGGTVVYKATLRDGRNVAIKSFDGDEAAFRAELAVVSGLRHPHIVRLLCWWEGDGTRLLVYEYVGDGTLRDHLRRGDCASWSARTEVLLAAARAIEHVHCHAIVLGNVGSSNILLDATRKPRVSGFGASVVDAVGSRTGRLESAAGDVRGFGVVMLEVLTGREPVVRVWKAEKKGEVDVALASFALPSIEAGKLGDVLDRRPAAKPTPRQLKALKLVADMAARCVSPPSSQPGKGPTMSDVVARLKEAYDLMQR